jgi:hypothetical protein
MGANKIKLLTLEEHQEHHVAEDDFSQWQVQVVGWFKVVWHHILCGKNNGMTLALSSIKPVAQLPTIL